MKEPLDDELGLGLRDVQYDLAKWHRGKYPDATLSDIGLKLAEEAGEVCRAIDRIKYAKNATADKKWRENLIEEIGDAAIVLIVLCCRGDVDFEDIARLRAAEIMERE